MSSLIARFSSMFRSAPPIPAASGKAAARADASGASVPLRERGVRVELKASFTTFFRAVVEAGKRLLGRSVQQVVPVNARSPARSSMRAMAPGAQQAVYRKTMEEVRRETPIYKSFTLRGEGGHELPVKVQDTLPKDLERVRYTVGTAKRKREFDISHQTQNGSTQRAGAVHEAIQALREELGSDELLTAVSRFAHQGAVAGVMAAMQSKDSPVRDARGQPVMLFPSSESTSICVEKLGDGCARVDVEYRILTTASLMASSPDATASAAGMTPLDPERSSARFLLSLMVTDRGTAQLLGPPMCEYQVTPQPLSPAAPLAERRQAGKASAAGAEASFVSQAELTQDAAPALDEGAVQQAVDRLLSQCLGTDPKERGKRLGTANSLEALVRAQLVEAGAAGDPEWALQGSVDRARDEFDALTDEVGDASMLESACAAAMRGVTAPVSLSVDEWVGSVSDQLASAREKAALAKTAEAELRVATAGHAGRPAPGAIKAMAGLVAQRSASLGGMKPAMDEAMRLFQEFTAVERLHPTTPHDDERPSEKVEGSLGRMQAAAGDGRFEPRLAELRQELAKDLIRRMVTVRVPDRPDAPESWLRKLLREEAPSMLPVDTSLQRVGPVVSAGEPTSPTPVGLRAQRLAMRQPGNLTGLLRQIDRDIAPAMLDQLRQAMDAQPTRPLHEVAGEQEAGMREAVLALLLRQQQPAAA